MSYHCILAQQVGYVCGIHCGNARVVVQHQVCNEAAMRRQEGGWDCEESVGRPSWEVQHYRTGLGAPHAFALVQRELELKQPRH